MTNFRVMACVGWLVLTVSLRPLTAQALPDRLDSVTFWNLVDGISGPTGTFGSENLVSNELAYGTALPALRQLSEVKGGVYIGVGPEQNFTYIAALQPQIGQASVILRVPAGRAAK